MVGSLDVWKKWFIKPFVPTGGGVYRYLITDLIFLVLGLFKFSVSCCVKALGCFRQEVTKNVTVATVTSPLIFLPPTTRVRRRHFRAGVDSQGHRLLQCPHSLIFSCWLHGPKLTTAPRGTVWIRTGTSWETLSFHLGQQSTLGLIFSEIEESLPAI